MMWEKKERRGMTEKICSWCKHADGCEIRRGLQTRTAMQGGVAGMVDIATIKEVVVECKKYECLFPKKGAER